MRPNSAIASTNCVGLAPTCSVRMIPVAGTLPKRRKATLTQVFVRLLLEPLWLQLTGREGVKPFIQAEIGEFMGNAAAFPSLTSR